VDTLAKLGFEAKVSRVANEDFKNNKSFTLPAIARVLTKTGLTHFVVIHKIYKDKLGSKATIFVSSMPLKNESYILL
jgi:ATP-binding cassette subfamily B protein